jgi:hypothetical protein
VATTLVGSSAMREVPNATRKTATASVIRFIERVLVGGPRGVTERTEGETILILIVLLILFLT